MNNTHTDKRRADKQNSAKNQFTLLHWHKVVLCLVAYDVVAMSVSYIFALWLRFDCNYSEIPAQALNSWLYFTPIYVLFGGVVFWILRLYQSIWRFASYTELKKVAISSVITAVFHTVGITVLFERMPISYYLIGAGVQFALVLLVRFVYRFVNLERQNRTKLAEKAKEALK